MLFLKQILRVTEENNKLAVFIWLEMVEEIISLNNIKCLFTVLD